MSLRVKPTLGRRRKRVDPEEASLKAVFAVLLVLGSFAEVSAQRVVCIQDVAWLQGCWELVSPTTTIEEQWMAPLGKNMVGVSRTVRADSLVAFEAMVIREQGSRLIYQAHPSGQATADFYSHVVGDSVVIFENLTHDFPQRIGYRRSSPDSLMAWIEGTINGEQRRLDFLYRRVRCSGD